MRPIKLIYILIPIIILFVAAFALKYWPQDNNKDQTKKLSDMVMETIEAPKKPVIEPVELPEELEVKEPVIAEKPKNNIVKVTQKELEPENLIIQKGSTVTWVVEDSKFHRISCYGQDDIRMALSDILKNKGEKYALRFNENGEFLCMDAVFGLRGKVIVKEQVTPLTGAAIGISNLSATDFKPLILLLVIIAGIIIANVLVKKRDKATTHS